MYWSTSTSSFCTDTENHLGNIPTASPEFLGRHHTKRQSPSSLNPHYLYNDIRCLVVRVLPSAVRIIRKRVDLVQRGYQVNYLMHSPMGHEDLAPGLPECKP